MNMREKMVRALWADSSMDADYDDLSAAVQDVMLKRVDAVLFVLREPENDILAIGYEAMFASKWDGSQAPMMGAGWQAMIDAISSDQHSS